MIKRLQNFVEKYSLFLLILILLIGIYSRVRLVLDKSFPFTYDIGRDLLVVSGMVHHFTIPLIGPTTGLPGLFYGPWWYYSLVPAFIVGGGNPQIINLFMALTGIVVIIIGYFVGVKISGKGFGLILASLLSFSPSLIAASTQIWNPNIAPMYLVLIFLVLLTMINNKKAQGSTPKIRYLVLLGLLAGLNIDSEVVYGLILSFALSIFLGIFVFKKKIVNYLYFLFGIIIIFSPRIFFELRHDFIMTRSIINSNLHGNSLGIFSNIPGQFAKSLMAIIQLWELTIGMHSLVITVILGLGSIGIVTFYFKSLSYAHKLLIKYCLITVATYLIALTFFGGDIWGHYLVGVPVIYIFIFATACWLLRKNSRLLPFGVLILVFVLISQFDPYAVYSYYAKPIPYGDASLYRNQEEIVDYVYHEAKGRKFNEIVYTPPVHDYTYQYLFLWHGEKNYRYQPSLSHEQLFFVILEPDPGYEGRLRDWLESRKDDGKVIKETHFTSGIIVQTRLH